MDGGMRKRSRDHRHPLISRGKINSMGSGSGLRVGMSHGAQAHGTPPDPAQMSKWCDRITLTTHPDRLVMVSSLVSFFGKSDPDQVRTLLRRPSPLISTVTRSPGFMNLGGLKPMPTPAGVPVAMMSPG